MGKRTLLAAEIGTAVMLLVAQAHALQAADVKGLSVVTLRCHWTCSGLSSSLRRATS
jgi:hypothetical protein